MEARRRARAIEDRRTEVKTNYSYLCAKERIFVPHSAIFEFPSFLEVTNNQEEEIDDEKWAMLKNDLLRVNAHVKHRIMEAAIEVWKSKKPTTMIPFDFSMITAFLATDPANNTIPDETCLDRPNMLFSQEYVNYGTPYDDIENKISVKWTGYWQPEIRSIALPAQEEIDLINTLTEKLPDTTWVRSMSSLQAKGSVFICKRCEHWHDPMSWKELVWLLLTGTRCLLFLEWH